MQKPTFDPGLTQQYTGNLRRAINKDGTFNVRRRGATWRDFHPYLRLIDMGWVPFFGVLFMGYLVVNTLFALAYFWLGPGHLLGADASTAGGRFFNDFFFSAHTLSTVGYGSISPKSLGSNIVAAMESLVGVLGFAMATGLLFGRVSRPSAKIGFSEKMLVAPYQDMQSLQFRVVNRRRNDLMEIEARVLLMTVEDKDGQPARTYRQLALVWGVMPFLVPHVDSYEQMAALAKQVLLAEGIAKPGDRVVVTAGVPFDVPGTTNNLKVETV